MAAEQRDMLAPSARRSRARPLLDLACGTGRYARLLEQAGAQRVVGVDFSWAMLARRYRQRECAATSPRFRLLRAAFDVVVSGLALGHAADLARCARECARVLARDGVLVYSDFHPEGCAPV